MGIKIKLNIRYVFTVWKVLRMYQKKKTVDKPFIPGITMVGGGSVSLEKRLIKLPKSGFVYEFSDLLYLSKTHFKSEEVTKIKLTEKISILVDKNMDLLYQNEYNFTYKSLLGEKIHVRGPVAFEGSFGLTEEEMYRISSVYNNKHDYLDVSKL